ncbi:beta-ketoacyl-ACP synthase II [Candidatus Roseilinea sp. NK_OTU-006]|jgi:beta-ketoacyl-acyl-carrier-protein synthase II|nr:beta-ketoacyl-ACP synthase II [Candidatus Roseilinea sp. NK_OTU-006]
MARPKRFSGLRRGLSRFTSASKRMLRRGRDAAEQPRPTLHIHVSSGNKRRRVVITGIGAITVLGLNLMDTWNNLVEGRSGIGPITQFDPSNLPVRIAGEVKGFDPLKYIDAKEVRRMARCSHFAVAAAQEAFEQSGLRIGKDAKADRVGVVMGTALGGYEMSEAGSREYYQYGYKRTNPFALPAALPNAPGHHISTRFGLKGPLSTVVAACASGTQAIGDGAEMIRLGKADAVLAGGVEAVVIPTAIAAFSKMRVLSTMNDHPELAQRPFDITRDGFAYSEGCVVMMLEDYERARARGATIYAEVLGLGVSSDAYHIAIPDPSASGAIRAMMWALQDAGLAPHHVDYINAHGSATQANDALETAAIKQVFGERAYDIPVTSTKSMVGHAMGAAGAIEALSTVMTIKTGIIPPTINLHHPDPACDLDYVPHKARLKEVNFAISNSFGLGGQNATIAFGKV